MGDKRRHRKRHTRRRQTEKTGFPDIFNIAHLFGLEASSKGEKEVEVVSEIANIFRFLSPWPSHNRYKPHQGEKEKARRRRQIEKGMLSCVWQDRFERLKTTCRNSPSP
jgi:hypothetical protein